MMQVRAEAFVDSAMNRRAPEYSTVTYVYALLLYTTMLCHTVS
jgi:hypothetical protein